MKKIKWWLAFLPATLWSLMSFSQGPPILGDKPIMLSQNTWVLKTLTEVRKTEEGSFSRAPLMVHYLPTTNSLVGVHIPFVKYNFTDGVDGNTLGDIEILAKYQFYRKDQTGKTFRVVAKTLQTLPTGEPINIEGISRDAYQSYVGLVAGYETIKYGISNELGYNLSPNDHRDEFRYKLGFGLPLLKPTYPVNQINLYFEYQNIWSTELDEFLMLYAQGLPIRKRKIHF